MNNRNLILVTGAPRTATTPVGNMLATARRAVTLYEPLGPTGVQGVDAWMPMVGDGLGLSASAVDQLISDLSGLRPGPLKTQQRPRQDFSLKRALFGSRTLHSFRLASLQPWSQAVIWKDPHANMLATDVALRGVPVVVTARRAKAHASSYRRLGWVSRAAEIYPRWAQRFGACPVVEGALGKAQDSIISSALIWRMSYLPLIRENCLDRVHLVTSDALVADERATYTRLFDRLGLVQTAATEKLLTAEKSATRSRPDSKTSHDWTRSVAAVNSYWKELLTDDDAAQVDRLTGDVEEALFGSVQS
ncbi:sulfotransferase [Qipengyuania marisflavi]|uniref:Sulfotransferase n=1 Tax=Qipengyuania marisflavi TaxID=2486356 RepID=A0A5S3P258_9SPHN|nr:sulfotransferase [Qipengyuania marisflavi]TMM46739.1 sulfotransferase [Qipengyuania marisflavi]